MPERTLYLDEFTFNSVTYTGGSSGIGGPLRARWNNDPQNLIKDRTGSDDYPTAVYPVDKDCTLTITMRDTNVAITMGTTGNIVAKYNDDAGVVKTVTYANMVFVGTTSTQDRATTGEADYIWTHESTDGTTNPITEA